MKALSSNTPLLRLLRGELRMTGTKFGCGMALCCTRTVYVDGQPVRGCVTPIAARLEMDVVPCGYCQGVQIMAAAALLKKNPAPTDADIDTAMAGNLCRHGTYPRIRAEIHLATKTLAA